MTWIVTPIVLFALWYVGRSARLIPAWRQIKIRHGAAFWMRDGNAGELPASASKKARRAPRMSVVNRQAEHLLMASIGALILSLVPLVGMIQTLMDRPEWLAAGGMPMAIGFCLAQIVVAGYILRLTLRFDQLIPVISAPAIAGMYADYGLKARLAAEAETRQRQEEQAKAADSAPPSERARPNYELRLPADDGEEVAA